MKFDATEPFLGDYARLSEREHTLFMQAVARINVAYAARGAQPLPVWPSSLRIRNVERKPGVFEMTWSFAGPDGRATFEYITIGDEAAIRWRRIGDHRIFREP